MRVCNSPREGVPLNLRDSILELLGTPRAQYSQAELLNALKLPRSLKRRLSDVLEKLVEEWDL